MSGSTKEQLSMVVNRIIKLKSQLDDLRGWSVEHQLAGPARPKDVDAVERMAAFPLPEDYREFLLMHDGWIGMRGENDLLSTSQLQSDSMKSAIEELKEIQLEMDDPALNGFVIDASLGDTDIAYFDPSSLKESGTIDVVRWDARAGEYARYESFTGYLIGLANSLDRRIQSEMKKQR